MNKLRIEADRIIGSFAPPGKNGEYTRKPREPWFPVWHGPGRIATLADLESAQLTGQPRGTFSDFIAVTEEPGGFCADHLELHLPDSIRDRHLLVVGRTGSGKSTRVMLPAIWRDLIETDKTVIVLDAKGDLTGPVIEMAKKARGKGVHLRFLSFDDPDRSVAWNPFADVSDAGEASEIAQCLSSTTLLNGGGGDDSPFFRLQAEKLISSLMVALQGADGGCTPARMKALLDLPVGELVRALEGLKVEIKQVMMAATENKNAETVLLEAETHFLPFADPRVLAVTSQSEFSFCELSDKPTVLIVRCPEGVSRLAAIASIFVKRLFSFVLKRAEEDPTKRLPRKVAFYCDEFASALGRLPDMERRINTLRSRGFQFTAAIQTLEQLTDVYGHVAGKILYEGFGSMIAIPPISFSDAQVLSQRTGQILTTECETIPGTCRILRETIVVENKLLTTDIAFPPVHPDRGSMATLLLPEMPPVVGYFQPIWRFDGFTSWDQATGGEVPGGNVSLRNKPIPLPETGQSSFGGRPSRGQVGLISGTTDTRGMSNRMIKELLEETKKSLDWENTTGSARKWWESFESENENRAGLVLKLAEELKNRKATITEFFLSYVYSNTDNIMANLHYMDYTRLKKEEERKKRQKPQDSE